MMAGKQHISSRRHGFAMADVVIGLAILAVLGTAFFTAVNRQRRGAERLADARGATWYAEYALAVMQSGRAADGVQVEPIAGDAPTSAHVWVRVRAQQNGQSAILVGLVARQALPEGGRP
jgi:hypothetical protein